MSTVKMYGWVLKLVGAALLVGLALFLKFGNGEEIVVPFLGAVIIISSIVRLVPFIKTQKSDLIKTINIIEITVDVGLGLTLILVTLLVEGGLGNLFGYLLGIYLMLRGAVHFFSVSTKHEKSDLILYAYHIATLIVGSYVFFKGDFVHAILINIILVFAVIAGGYLSYDGFNGYNSYRRQKTLTMPDEKVVEPTVEKRVPVVEEEQEQDQIVA